MKVITRNKISDTQLENIKLPMEDLSKALRRDIFTQVVDGLVERMPVEVTRTDDMFEHGYDIESEFYVYTREQLQAIVDHINSARINKKDLIGLLAIDLKPIEDIKLFPEDIPVPTKEEAEADPAKSTTDE